MDISTFYTPFNNPSRANDVIFEALTDENIFDNSILVTHFPDFPLWENRIAYVNKSKSFYLK